MRRHGSTAITVKLANHNRDGAGTRQLADDRAIVGAISVGRLSQSSRPSAPNLDRFSIRATSRRLF
jgi:hypothetical protein